MAWSAWMMSIIMQTLCFHLPRRLTLSISLTSINTEQKQTINFDYEIQHWKKKPTGLFSLPTDLLLKHFTYFKLKIIKLVFCAFIGINQNLYCGFYSAKSFIRRDKWILRYFLSYAASNENWQSKKWNDQRPRVNFKRNQKIVICLIIWT